MNLRSVNHALMGAALALTLTGTAAHAQWSIGAPGDRTAPAGKHRYVMLVFANPIPGHEAEFNDWYSNTHMGDLVQLQGWMGAQRFKMLTNVQPRLSTAGYGHGYLIIWDLEETEAPLALSRMTEAIAGGKSRLGAAFNYTPGAGANGTFEVLGPRIKRADGKGPTQTDPKNNKTPRLNRYVLMDFSTPLPGKEAEFDSAMNQTIQSVLKLPGWMAAQRFHLVDVPGRPSAKPKYLTVWETEGTSAQGVHDTLMDAVKNGAVKKYAVADDSTAEMVYWEPITPYITKEDFTR